MRKRIVAIIGIIILLLTSTNVHGENSTWDCPECGRVGNTGNYCGGCGHPAPTQSTTSTPAPVTVPTTAPTAKPTPEPIQAGDIIQFGHYPQTAAGDDNTPIEWLVLEVDARNNQALLISRYGLDAKPYNTQRTGVVWEKCTLRTWLNNEFYNRAFSAAEKSAILVTTVDNSKSQGYKDWNDSSGKSTKDKVFLLSYAEVNKYFGVIEDYGNMSARVAPTAYAVKKGAYASHTIKTEDGKAAGFWLLRSPGETQYINNYVICVGCGGRLAEQLVRNSDCCIRPALRVDLSAGNF